MRKHHPKNERIKRRYRGYLAATKRNNESSMAAAEAAIADFETWSKYRDFAKFHIEQAKGYKAHLETLRHTKSGKPLAKATIHARLAAVKAFFLWLAGQSGYRSRISYSDADYFNTSANDGRIATAHREKRVPTIEQVKHVLSLMAAGTDIEKRDRAIIAFTLLTGARDSAVASFRLKHVDLAARKIDQDARDVRTKNRKTFISFFFPVGDEVEAIVAEWIGHLEGTLRFGPDDPLFPATKVEVRDGLFTATGLSRDGWKNATTIRKVFRAAFAAASLPYANPHRLRDTLAQLGERRCRTPEEFKAWSQNLGHEQVLTTFTSYGAVATDRQAHILGELNALDGVAASPNRALDEIAALVDRMRKTA